MCIFCDIAKKEIPAKILYEDNDVLVFLDINPKCEGHALVIPKKHFETVFDIPKDVLSKMYEVAGIIVKKEFEVLHKDGCSLSFNYGSSQEIKHAHLHIINSYKEKINRDVEEVYKLLKD